MEANLDGFLTRPHKVSVLGHRALVTELSESFRRSVKRLNLDRIGV